MAFWRSPRRSVPRRNRSESKSKVSQSPKKPAPNTFTNDATPALTAARPPRREGRTGSKPMQQASTSSSTGNEQSRQPRLVGIDRLLSRLSTLRERIARRAFEIFKGRGGTNGSDLDDWFQAEAELCQGVRLEVTELDDALIVHTAVPAFSANELEICIEPLRLIITGERNPKGDQSSSDHILVVFGLPTPVDPSRVAAT